MTREPLFLDLVDTVTGAAPRFPTRVRAFWDDEALSVEFHCRDTRRWHTLTERDAPLWQEEVVELFLAPGLETPTRYAEFEVNPAGVLFDALIDNPDGVRATIHGDVGWDCPGLEAEVHLAAPTSGRDDWTVRLRVPWAGLAPIWHRPVPAPVWRANFLRVERPAGPHGAGPSSDADEFSAWSPTRRDPADFHVPRRFGVLVLDGPVSDGLAGLEDLDVPVFRVPHTSSALPDSELP